MTTSVAYLQSSPTCWDALPADVVYEIKRQRFLLMAQPLVDRIRHARPTPFYNRPDTMIDVARRRAYANIRRHLREVYDHHEWDSVFRAFQASILVWDMYYA